MVNLTRIYTRTGDDGTTALGDMSRTTKTDPRLIAYADTNEANAAIGVAVAAGALPDDVSAVLTRIQNDLFDVGADLATPVVENPEYPPLRVEQGYIDRLEADCDRFARAMGYPIIPCDLCGSQDGLQRREVKRMLDAWEKDSPGRRQSLFRALAQATPSHLLDPALFDFKGL